MPIPTLCELSILNASVCAVENARESPLCLYLICPLCECPVSPKFISQILVVSGTLIWKSAEPEVELSLAKVLPVPSTSSKKFGETVPIPTFLLASIVKAVSVPTFPLSFILNLPLSE